MGGKHMKKLRAEKSKVHFKKKILPKGQNLTNTTFIVKKILTGEQLKNADENEPVSNWNVPLKDLLVRLNHYNVTSRLNGLSGIKEILSKHPKILKGPALKSLVCRLLELITDEESKVREITVDLLKYLFGLIPSVSIVPFHDLLNAHLGCAMTNRSAKVQFDSLKLIDVMIKYSPEAIKHNFISITQNFIRIIKNCLFETHIDVLIANKSKHILEKTKTEMLLRFYQFLVVGCSDNNDEKVPGCIINNVNILFKQKKCLRHINDQYKKIPDLSLLFKGSEDNNRNLSSFDFSDFQCLCLYIIPLVFDIWTEFSPNQITSEIVLSEEIGELLSVLLKILLVLYLKAEAFQNIKMELWFITNYGPRFQKFFTSNFPYLSSVSTKKSKSSCKFSEVLDNFVVQNLVICYLSYSFKVVPENSNIETKMENYLCDALMMTNPNETEILLKVIEIMINASKYKNPNIILNKVVATYNSTENLEFQQSLSKILTKVILEENENIYLRDSSFKNWIKSLPHCLCKPQIFLQDIEIILKLIIKPIGVEVLREIEYKVEEITRNLPSIKINGILQLEGQKMIANILYKCNNEVIEGTVKKEILNNTVYPVDLRNYIVNIFSHKLKYNYFY